MRNAPSPVSAFGYVEQVVIPATMRLLPTKMDSPSARVMLLAIGLQETRFEHRHQVGGGPAHGFWQFEKGGGVRGVRGYIFSHAETKELAKQTLLKIGYRDATEEERFIAIEHNDILACMFARLLLWTHPDPLPKEGEKKKGWKQYLDTWRPGKPREETWDDFFDLAWYVVSRREG